MANNLPSIPKQITICLEESKYAHGLKQEESIHSHNFNRVIQLIKNQVEKLNTKKSPYNVEHQYNTISIFGGRGTGKTTFILSLLQSIEKEYENDAEILKIIDPTQMEEKEHVFLVILSLIDTEVRRKIESHRKDNNASCCCFEKEWRNKLSSLAKGLPTLEGLNKKQYENWDDDLYIVERGLNNVKSAYDLERNFHELVDIALEILGKKFFVLAFDDIDVDMSKGWSVLETIRKYLTTPKFVIFLSGNLTLYSYNVRLHQWNQLKGLTTFEEHDYKSQVNQLEGQYLLKVLKPENRIQLRTLLDYKHIYQTPYMIKEEGKEIEEVYSNILKNFGIHKNSTQRLFIDYLLGLSIRSQISILSDYTEPDIMSQINVYVSRMIAANIDVDLAVKNPIFTTISIVEYLKKSNGFPHSYLLIPNTINHDMNGVLMGLTTIFANQAKQSPWIIFDYMLRVGYTRHLNLQLSTTAFNQILSHTGIMQDMSIKNIVLLMAAVGKANNLKLPELILLEGLGSKAKKGPEEKENAIDNILKGDNINMTQKVLALLPLFSLGKGQRQNTELYYSVLPLLSTICMIIRSGKDVSSIKSLLSDLSLHRTYPMSSEDQVVSDAPESNITSNEELSQSLGIDIEDKILDDLIIELILWRKDFIKDNENSPTLILPPYLLGRIMTRFTSALINVPNKKNLAELFQQHLILFLNSVLIEEAKEKFGDKVNVNNNNPVDDPKLFYDNLGKVTSKTEGEKSYLDSLTLIRCLLSCPLICVFFNTKVSSKIKEYFDAFGFNDITLFDGILSRAEFKTKENSTNGTIKITKDNLKESLGSIIKKEGEETFKTQVYDIANNAKARKALLNLDSVKSIGQGCTKKLKELYKKEYIDKQ
ncbi:crinivirus P26 protein [Prevotella melaninogenica]|uniref:Crinivirus P26 protein n=1 Tax=Prevotella melaninogenica TaxID=28132 RepID=A0ABX7XSF7_9BACT|nr:crinivirus P26 protein [Prevotella melaninogenica]QUB76566.1 crinivirus P26 protein [Prevotella melaninogenica]